MLHWKQQMCWLLAYFGWLELLVTGELVKFCWYTYSYFYLKLDEKEQSDKPPQQSSTKKTGKEKCFINN